MSSFLIFSAMDSIVSKTTCIEGVLVTRDGARGEETYGDKVGLVLVRTHAVEAPHALLV
jgi:hypothetical protein